MASHDHGQHSTHPRGTTSSSSSGGVEAAREKASEVKDQVQGKAAEVKEQVANQATSRLEQGKEQAVESLGTVASAVRQTGGQLRKQDHNGVAEYVERAAGRIEEFGAYLGNRSLNELVADAESFARREPTLFVGGSFLLGLFGARFLKSSGQAESRQETTGVSHTSSSGFAHTPQFGGSQAYQAPMGASTPAWSGSAGTSAPPMGATGASAGMGAASGDVIVGGPPISDDVVVGGPPVDKPVHERRLAAFDQGRENS